MTCPFCAISEFAKRTLPVETVSGSGLWRKVNWNKSFSVDFKGGKKAVSRRNSVRDEVNVKRSDNPIRMS